MSLWNRHDGVPDGTYAMQNHVADCPIDVEGMHEAVCTATSNCPVSMLTVRTIVQLKLLIVTIGIRNVILDTRRPHSVCI
jgi:hypothetical protein